MKVVRRRFLPGSDNGILTAQSNGKRVCTAWTREEESAKGQSEEYENFRGERFCDVLQTCH
jgi:hypothetical protein